MLRFAPLLAALALLLGRGTSLAAGQKVLAIQGLMVEPYREVLEGFREACPLEMEILTLDERARLDLAAAARELEPALILAIGREALIRAAALKGPPILYVMVLNPAAHLPPGAQATGVSLDVSPGQYLAWLKKAAPKAVRIGVLFAPSRTGYLVDAARSAATSMGLQLTAVDTADPRHVPDRLRGLRGKLDALWMVPDVTVVTPETVESFLLFCQAERIPLMAFSAKYVELGALMSLDVDVRECGRQAGEMAMKIRSGTPASAIPRSEPRRASLTFNLRTARILGLDPGREVLDGAKIINPE